MKLFVKPLASRVSTHKSYGSAEDGMGNEMVSLLIENENFGRRQRDVQRRLDKFNALSNNGATDEDTDDVGDGEDELKGLNYHMNKDFELVPRTDRFPGTTIGDVLSSAAEGEDLGDDEEIRNALLTILEDGNKHLTLRKTLTLASPGSLEPTILQCFPPQDQPRRQDFVMVNYSHQDQDGVEEEMEFPARLEAMLDVLVENGVKPLVVVRNMERPQAPDEGSELPFHTTRFLRAANQIQVVPASSIARRALVVEAHDHPKPGTHWLYPALERFPDVLSRDLKKSRKRKRAAAAANAT